MVVIKFVRGYGKYIMSTGHWPNTLAGYLNERFYNNLKKKENGTYIKVIRLLHESQLSNFHLKPLFP